MLEQKEKNKRGISQQVFRNKFEKTIFKKWLKVNDSISPVFESRRVFIRRKGNFLIKTNEGGGKSPDSYDLRLPEDLKVGELIKIISEVEKLVIQNDNERNGLKAVLGNIIATTGVSVAKLFKDQGLDQGQIEQKTNMLASQYGTYLTSKQLDELKNFKIKKGSSGWREGEFGTARRALRKLKTFKKSQQENESLDQSNKEQTTVDFLTQQYKQGLDRVIFRRGKRTLYDFMQTFTQDDFDKLDKFDKRIKINIQEKEKYDKTERYLRDAIGINKFIPKGFLFNSYYV